MFYIHRFLSFLKMGFYTKNSLYCFAEIFRGFPGNPNAWGCFSIHGGAAPGLWLKVFISMEVTKLYIFLNPGNSIFSLGEPLCLILFSPEGWGWTFFVLKKVGFSVSL